MLPHQSNLGHYIYIYWIHYCGQIVIKYCSFYIYIAVILKYSTSGSGPGFRLRGDWRREAVTGEEFGAESRQWRLITGSVGDVVCEGVAVVYA